MVGTMGLEGTGNGCSRAHLSRCTGQWMVIHWVVLKFFTLCLTCDSFDSLSDFHTFCCAVACLSYAVGVTPAGDAKIAPVRKLAENV